ncbi:ERCC4 domain containing protein [Ectocarpus siliculosus]|uniref:ERCC4 domain containing protein n=1 Tax=Ectocarpus siliculosus TaxID=2880 RepID=D7FIK5_ECTSI|nr:ERCC4 domain containing protein [Ectocarpus siliculosus]|eukprot:CBJ28823.1 ERCC4 domain containing protein [Ectocarpus siliculosus]
MKDGRLVRQKKAMLRAKSDGVAAEVEVHVEGDTADGRFVDEIYRRGLTPEDLDEALRQAETQGFKVVRHNDFAAFSAYLADATQSLQRQFEARSLDFESFFTWQNLIRFSKGQVPLTPKSAAAAAAAGKAAAAAKAARGGRRGRPPTSAAAGGRGRPPLASRPAGDGLRQRTLDGVFGVARSGEDGASGGGEAEGNCPAVGGARGREETAESHAPKAASTREGAIDIDGSPDPGSASDSSDGCSVVEVVVRPIDGGGGSGSGSSAGSGSGSTSGSKRKAAPAVAAGTSSSSIAGGGVSSAAAAAAAASSVSRTSPIALSPSEPGAAAASSRSVLHGGGGAEDSPLPTTLGRRAGGQSGSVGRNSSRRSKRPRPADEGSRGGDGSSSPLQSCAQGISGGGGSEWGGVEGTRNKKARSLSFVLDDEDDDRKGGGGRGGDGDLRQANGSGSASSSGGGKGSGSSFGSLPSAASRSVHDGGGGGVGGVVDLSLDSPSPPVPPRSRPRTAVSPPRPTSSSGGGVSGGTGTDGIVLEACSSDDEFSL